MATTQGAFDEGEDVLCQSQDADAARPDVVNGVPHAGLKAGKKQQDDSSVNGVVIRADSEEDAKEDGVDDRSHGRSETDDETVSEESGPEGSDATDSIIEETDFFQKKSVLQSCAEKKKKLNPSSLEQILQSRKNQEANERENLDDIDQYGYAAIHYIVTNGHKGKSSLLEKLVIHGADVDLTTTCREGRSALHLAVEAKNLECVKALISLDADVNVETFMGVTPLDLAGRLVYSGQEDIELTKLYHKTRHPKITTEESPSKRQKLDHSPEEEMKAIIEVLESVGAVKGSSSNSWSRSPSSSPERALSPHKSEATSSRAYIPTQYHSINTKHYRIVHDNIGATMKEETVTSKAALKLVEEMKKQQQYRKACGSRILCLDGGGVRGLIQMTILREIERQMKMSIVDLFDWVVGTSTGGIIALALTYGPGQEGEGRKTISQLRDIYWLMKDEIFGESSDGFLGFLAKGNTEKLEKTLKSWLGSDTRLHQKSYPKVLVPAVYKKDANLELHVFNNCFGDKYSKELVWKVGRYTSAAPFYFTEFEDYIDGGMLANNPSETALTHIQDHFHEKGEKIPISLLVSVGSGINPSSPLGKIDIQKNPLKPQAYLNLMAVLESAVIGKQMDASCRSRCREQGIEYFRFNPQLSQKVDSGQHDSTILQDMVLRTRQYLREKSVKEEIDHLVQLLKNSELTST